MKIFSSLITGKSRSIKYDSQKALTGINPPIHIIGSANIPHQGPALVTLNHYARPGFTVAWAALAISAQLPEDQFWLMSGAWTNRTTNLLDISRTFATKVLFKRLAEIYGLVNTPPMPPVETELPQRAASIRRVFSILDIRPTTILCIAPEGRDFAYGTLGIPSSGTGKFMQHLAKRSQSIIPVGVWEGCGRLIINFGVPYGYDEISGKNDEDASRAVMYRIAELLPARMRKNIPGE